MNLTELAASVAAEFQKHYGCSPRWIVAAPGRVNVIGEHTDYNDGFVLPMAIERYAIMAADASATSGNISIFDTHFKETATIDISAPVTKGPPKWSNYIRGVLAGFQQRGVKLPALDIAFPSTVPLGGGLSSSAALEVCTATLLKAITGRIDPVEKALLAQKAEHEFAGVPCGIMDQFISVLGREGHLLLLDCRTRQTELVPLSDPSVEVLVTISLARCAANSWLRLTSICSRASALVWFWVRAVRDRMEDYFVPSRQLLALIFFCVTCWLSSIASAAEHETIRQYLSGHDAERTVTWNFFCSDGRNSGVWTNIAVPSCWELQGFGKFRYGHEDKNYTPIRGDYRHRFNVPTDWRGKRIFIVFEGAMTDAAVKVNGTAAGPLHQGAFYRFKYDITELLKFGEENLLEVSVSDKSTNASVNNAERNADYWVFGGIFRPVWLQAEPVQFVDHVAIDARADGTFALSYYLGGEGQADAVEVTLQDAWGKTVGEPVSVPVAVGHVATIISAPALWTAETPALYNAIVQLKQGATVLHELKQRFGFRTIEVRQGEGLLVNGQRVLLRGVCHHVAWPTLGRASSDRLAALDLDLIQDMNMNAVRMSHYPPDEAFLEMCDERGLYVLDELTGWQHQYDTVVGRQHVKEMISRDVNHPSIVMWDNGNEGGWNTNLDADFAQLDPQHRAVNHPWAKFGDINDPHYPDYKSLVRGLAGNLVYMPTEFLHGLYDGGHGAGLDDYWNAMRASKVSAGGFLWVFADEGVQRSDLTNAIDVKGNWAPDGIVGPFREKEASYYTIKQIWSPVQLPSALPANFDGTLPVENRYEFTSLSQCKFTWQLRRFGQAAGFETIAQGAIGSPNVAPGKSGILKFDELANAYSSSIGDALAVTVRNPNGQELWTWVYPLQPQSKFAPTNSPVASMTVGDELRLKAGETEARIAASTGQLLGVKVGGKNFSLTSAPISNAKWTMLDSGWLQLDYAVDPAVQTNVVGVALEYPEEKMLKKTWLGDGPYRVWRNRLKGGTLGVWETAYNTTETGYKEWLYPEFAGYFANVRWLKLTTTEGTLTLIIPDNKTFVRVGTPKFPEAKLSGKTLVKFPLGNLAVVRDIPPTGDKFESAAMTGPQGTLPLVTAPYQGIIYLRFEPATATAAR